MTNSILNPYHVSVMQSNISVTLYIGMNGEIMPPTTVQVFIAGLLPILFTGLGALPLLFIRNVSRYWLGIGNALAAGLMLGASLGLFVEGLKHGGLQTLIGILSGVILVVYVHRKLNIPAHDTLPHVVRGTPPKILLILAVMTAHSFAEGIGVGVSYGNGDSFGALIALAIAIHKIPEGLAISLVLVPAGTPVWKAAIWGMFTSLPLAAMSMIAYSAALLFAPLLPIGLGVAAGGMTTMVILELLPDTLETIPRQTAFKTIAIAVMAMIFFQIVLAH